MAQVIPFPPNHSGAPARDGDEEFAERTLRSALLAAQDTEIAPGPVRSLRQIAMAARLLLWRRAQPRRSLR
jgi:hypothetical protein